MLVKEKRYEKELEQLGRYTIEKKINYEASYMVFSSNIEAFIKKVADIFLVKYICL